MKRLLQYKYILLLGLIVLGSMTFAGPDTALSKTGSMTVSETVQKTKPEGYPVATLAGGCFWCVESDIRRRDGILFTEVGYMGGTTENPTYEDISTGKTGHAEIVQVTYDPKIISYEEILDYFFTFAHDPTQKNRQGVDVGTQYRSAIFYHDEAQKKSAEKVIADLTAAKKFKDPIVTTLEPASTFWRGEGYHQQYYEKYEEKTGEQHMRVYLKEQKRRAAGKL